MHVELRQFSFELPPGFEDVTNYSFKDRDDTQVLTVSSGARPPEASDLLALLADRKRELEQMMPGAVTIEAELDGRMGEWPSRQLTFRVVDRKRAFREHWAVAFDTPKTYVQISYAVPTEDTQAADRFAHILRSVATAGVATRAGFARRWAGIFSLDVPASLAPPRAYLFSTSDEKTHLVLTVFDPVDKDPFRPEPTLEQEISEDQRLGTVSGKISTTSTIGSFEGSSLKYSLESETPDGDTREACRRTLIQLGDGVRIHLYGRAPAGAASSLDQTMDSWIRTFKPTK